jgi:hypothetical protein
MSGMSEAAGGTAAEGRSSEDLIRAMEESRAQGDIKGYFEAEVELEQLHLAHGQACFAAAQFADASDSFETVAKLNADLIAVLDERLQVAGGDAVSDANQLRDWRRASHQLMLMATGLSALADGQSSVSQRNPGAAVEMFTAAERAFREASTDGDGGGRFMADYALALRENASATEDLVRADYDGAASSYMRAKVRLESLLEEAAATDTQAGDAPGLPATFVPAVQFDASNVTAQFEKASYMAQFAQGNYRAASEHARNLCTILQASIDAIPDEIPDWLKNQVRANLAWAQADQERVSAFVLRDEERWDEANSAFERARDKLREAAAFMLRSGLPDAVAAQESLMALASVTIPNEMRQLRAEKEVKEELKRLRAEWSAMIEKLGSSGVTVTTIAEASAAAEQNTQIVVRVEQSVRDGLGDLQAAIDRAGLGAEGEKLKAEAAELQSSPDHGAPFLERVRKFTERVADVVKNVAEAAGPVLPVLKALAPLVGLAL